MLIKSDVLMGDEKRYAANALKFYSESLMVKVNQDWTLDEIQAWLKNRNINVPDYFLKQFIEGLKDLNSNEKEVKEYKQVEEEPKLVYKPVEEIKEEIKQEKGGIVMPKNKRKEKLEKKKNYFLEEAMGMLDDIKTEMNARGNAPVDVTEFRKMFGDRRDKSTFGHMLKALFDEGVMDRERKGHKFIYWLKDEPVKGEKQKEDVKEVESTDCSELFKEMHNSEIIPESQVMKGQFASVKLEAKEEIRKNMPIATPDIGGEISTNYDRNVEISKFITKILPDSEEITIKNNADMKIIINCNGADGFLNVHRMAKGHNFDVNLNADSKRGMYKITAKGMML